jgi:hypothetical protein
MVEQLRIIGKTLLAELWYPRCSDRPNAIEIALVDVRASDGLRIEYDFERDGWSIKQPSKLEFDDGENPNDFWTEVAFCGSWSVNLDKA